MAARDLDDFHDQWVHLVDRGFDEGVQSLDPDERIWFCCQSLIQAIFDGGLISYYFNSGADNVDECLYSLEKLNERDLADLIRRINARLYPTGVPKNLDDRNRVIDSLPDGDIDKFFNPIEIEAQKLAETLERRLVRFIEENHVAA